MADGHRQNDIEVLLVEAEHNLHPGNLVDGAEFDGLRGTQKIHRFQAVARCDTDFFEIQPRFFVLKQNFHRFGVGLTSFDQPEANLHY